MADHILHNVVRAIWCACEERGARAEAAQLAIKRWGLLQQRAARHEWGPAIQRVVDSLTEEPAVRSRVSTQVGQ